MTDFATSTVRVIGVRLSDGTEHIFEVSKLPRFWKSWVMNKLPYGTNFQGCAWIKSRNLHL